MSHLTKNKKQLILEQLASINERIAARIERSRRRNAQTKVWKAKLEIESKRLERSLHELNKRDKRD